MLENQAEQNRRSFQLTQTPLEVQAAYMEELPEIDGEANFEPVPPWVPIIDIDLRGRKATVAAWFHLGWNEEGLYVAVFLPEASSEKLMEIGGVSQAPFVVRMDLDARSELKLGVIGHYRLSFAPLVGTVSKMIYRSQPFLMNSHLGANSNLDDSNLVVWKEMTHAGILTDELETRWGIPEEGGLCLEVLVPWRNLRVEDLPKNRPVYFNLEVDQPGLGRNDWVSGINGERGTGGRVRLLGPGVETDGSLYNSFSLKPFSSMSLYQQPVSLPAAFPAFSNQGETIRFSLIDSDGNERISSVGDLGENSVAVFSDLDTKGLEDGPYDLRVQSSSDVELLSEKPIYLAGHAVSEDLVSEIAHLNNRIEGFTIPNGEVWRSGHVARARFCVEQAELPPNASVADLALSFQLLEDAKNILDALENNQRPDPGLENFDHKAGFAVDGQRGFVEIVPCSEKDAQLTIYATRETDWQVNPFIYGTFLEEVVYDRPICGELYAQRVRNSSFEWGHPLVKDTVEFFSGRAREMDPGSANQILEGKWIPILHVSEEQVAAPWLAVGNDDVSFSLVGNAFNSQQCQKINASSSISNAGVAQIISLPIWRCSKYNLKCYLRTENEHLSAKALVYYKGELLSEIALGSVAKDWQSFEAVFETPILNERLNAFLLAIVFDGPGTLFVDQVTVYPEDAVNGFDPQAVEQMRKLNTGWVRWPGGNHASAYHWRDGIGPIDKRPALPNPSWPGLGSNFVGTDEFMQFCQLTDIKPLICVNVGDGTAEEAADWVEYCNGSINTPMGKLRAENGHPEPYGAKYWNLGNELWGNWQTGYCEAEEYSERYRIFSRAMLERDPSIRLMVCAHGSFNIGDYNTWNRTLLEHIGRDIDLFDVHTYVRVHPKPEQSDQELLGLLTAIPVAYEQWLMEFRRECLQRGLDQILIDVGEYNGNIVKRLTHEKNEIGRLLLFAGWIHSFIRQGEYVMGSNATEYSCFDPRAGQFDNLHPRYDLYRFYAAHAGTQPVYARLETPVRQSPIHQPKDVTPIFNLPMIDVVTLRDPEDNSLGIGIINRDMERKIPVKISLEDFDPKQEGVCYFFGQNSGDDQTEFPKSHVNTETIDVNRKFSITMQPHCLVLVKVFENQ